MIERLDRSRDQARTDRLVHGDSPGGRREQLPIAGHAPEVDRPERVEDQVSPGRELADRPRHDDLFIGRLAQHSRSDVHADPADVFV